MFPVNDNRWQRCWCRVQKLRCLQLLLKNKDYALIYRGANKSLARPGRKHATATELQILQATQKQFRRLSVQPGLRGSNDLRVGRKMANFQLFFFQSCWAKDLSAPLYVPTSLTFTNSAFCPHIVCVLYASQNNRRLFRYSV